jgi:6-pyruvoyltetrahydropterin/6-carboxytetrahydropterin synthase
MGDEQKRYKQMREISIIRCFVEFVELPHDQKIRSPRQKQQSRDPMKLTAHCPVTLLLLLFLLCYRVAETDAIFHLGIRDSFMIAHSFHHHKNFGPAGGLHGATYTCDIEFAATDIDPECNWVIDIGVASELLVQVLAKYNYQNLDELFGPDVMTTTEFMARQIHRDLCGRLTEQPSPFQGSLCVKLWESHKAWASYSGQVV